MAAPHVWNGSAWVPVTKDKTAFWNGASWAEPTDIKYWDGAQWATVFGTGGGGGGGPITLRATASNQANAVNTLDLTVPALVEDGDMLVLAVAQTSNATTVFNAISGWTKQGEQRAGASAHTIAIYTRLAQPGDASSTVTTTSVNIENYTAHLRTYAGVHQTTPLDAAVAFAQVDLAATSGSAPAVTVATTDAMLITVYSVPTTSNTTLSAGDWTDPTSFIDKLTTCTANTNNNAALATYNQVAPGTGSQGPFSATITQSRRWATATIALRPA